ncbi:MAG: hypothetical protein ABF289_04375 [Clostridiales bacterium]
MYETLNFYATLDDYCALYNFLLNKRYKIFKEDTEREYKTFKRFEKDLLNNSKGIFYGIALNVNVSHPELETKEIILQVDNKSKIISRNGILLNIGSVNFNNICNTYIEYPDLDEYFKKLNVLNSIFPQLEPTKQEWESCLVILDDIKQYIEKYGICMNGSWVLSNALKTDIAENILYEPQYDKKNKKRDFIIEECDDVIRMKTLTGFEKPNDIYKSIMDKIIIEHPEIDIKNDILKIIDRHFNKKMREELRWYGKTDSENLNECFSYLNQKYNIYTRQNFTNCLTDGNYEILNIIKNDKNNNYIGYVYFHKQDLVRAIDYNCLFIAYGSTSLDNNDSIEIGKIVYENLKKFGFNPEWSGSPKNRIKISIEWKKRIFI